MSETPNQATAVAPDDSVLRQGDHDRGLHDVASLVTALERPTPGLLRVAVELPDAAAADPLWSRPNVTVRLNLGEAAGRASRVYTVRAFDPDASAMEFDVVLHGRPSPMMTWAAEVRVGDELRFKGPRPHFLVPEDAGRPVALFLDDTAVPALYTILRQWQPGRRAVGWVATDDEGAFAELPVVAGVRLRRIAQHAPEPGASLSEIAASLDDPASYVVWAAGERDEMRAIRQHFRATVGLSQAEVAAYGYWKRGVTNTEIDNVRLAHYARLVGEGGGLDDFDDLTIGI